MSRAGSPMWAHGGPSFTPQWESGDPLLLSPAHHSRGSTQKQSLGVGGSESCPPLAPPCLGLQTRCLPAAHSMGRSNCTHPKGVSPAESSVHIRDRPWSSGTAGSTTHGGPRGASRGRSPRTRHFSGLGWSPMSHQGGTPASITAYGFVLKGSSPRHGLDIWGWTADARTTQNHGSHTTPTCPRTQRLSTHSGSKAAPEMVRVTRVTTCCGLHVCVPQIYTVRP